LHLKVQTSASEEPPLFAKSRTGQFPFPTWLWPSFMDSPLLLALLLKHQC